MNTKEIFKAALRSTGLKEKDAVALVGLTPQKICARLAMGTLRSDKFLELMDAMGVDVTFTNRATGQVIRTPIKGAGQHVKAVVKGVTYDTAKSDALANNFDTGPDGEDSLLELYVDCKGRYFFAKYSKLDDGEDRIVPISPDDAAEFIDKYKQS